MVGPAAQFFQYVFIIVTAMQGPLCFICFVIFQEDVLTNLFKLVGSTPPAFLMAPKSSKSSKSTGAGAASESSHVPPTTVAHTKKDMNDDADVVSTPQYNEDGEEPTEDNIYSKIDEEAPAPDNEDSMSQGSEKHLYETTAYTHHG